MITSVFVLWIYGFIYFILLILFFLQNGEEFKRVNIEKARLQQQVRNACLFGTASVCINSVHLIQSFIVCQIDSEIILN